MVPNELFQCTECYEWNSYGCGGGEMVWDQFGRCEHCWDADSIPIDSPDLLVEQTE